MANVLASPASSLLDKTGLKRHAPVSPAVIPGMLFWWEPGTMADRGLVPKTGDLIENQSGWAVDLLGESARYLTVTNTITSGKVSRTSTGAFDVRHGRGVATGPEIFSLANQRIRDHVDNNRGAHRWAQVLAFEVLEKATDTYVPPASQRLMGFVDASNYKAAIALSNDRSQITGYPTGATRVFNQPGSATGGRSIVVTVHEGYTGAASASSTLLALHNGGANAPAPSLRLFQAGIADLNVVGLTPTPFAAIMQDRYNECQAAGGIYAA